MKIKQFYYFYKKIESMRYSVITLLLLLITISSCNKDFNTVTSDGNLEFSKNTVYLDTVFKNIGSSTYRLTVYNRSNNDITIPSIQLAKSNSKYRLMVDGRTGIDADNSGQGDGKVFPNVELLANDSLFVFIETTADIADANPKDMLYTDEIIFKSNTTDQKVNLVTLIQDAVFLYPERYTNGDNSFTFEQLMLDENPKNKIIGFELNENDPINGNELRFTNVKPYVIYGYAGVPNGKTLIIDKGARVHFHSESGIFVKKGGSIQVNGALSKDPKKLENEVIFEGDRLEPDFAEIPGQWGIIYLAEGSTNNTFNHTTIKNSSVGIFVDRFDDTTTNIYNTQIYNASIAGIYARQGKVNGENIVVNKSGQSSLAIVLGGIYNFNHCTFANYWNAGSRQTPAVILTNFFVQDPNTIDEITFTFNILEANFRNCIVYGSNNIELGINKKETKDLVFTTIFKNCLIKFNDTSNQFGENPLYKPTLTESTNLIGNVQNFYDPRFKDTSKNNLRIANDSPVKGKGNSAFIIPTDLDGKMRTSPPDLGAYQHLP
jgi:hypothetical protein